MVDGCAVRNEDRIGNDGADTAADLGRLMQKDEVMTARRALIRVGSHWYPIMLDLLKFMVAISRIEVNHDGHRGTARRPMTWDQGSSIKPRASSLWITIDHASLPGPPGFLDSSWRSFFHFSITQEDVAIWPNRVSNLLKFSSFLATLHWPQGAADSGNFGLSYLELLVMCALRVKI